MDTAIISTAYSGLKIAGEILSKILSKKTKCEVQKQIAEVQERLGQASDTLFSMREEQFRLQTENATLRQKIESKEEWQERISKYNLTETQGGAIIYQSKSEPRHFICPSCAEKQELHILQDRRVIAGLYICPKCAATFPVK